ncbi:Gfo/Idh/MocA family oxidoreductase [Actinoplanes sp. NPDC051411]|uniref:Gfo/Idh/MocA family protein n=1 Tax=Actinoplanes sp. NPDC051411 TaxID=3155522 RepID=UPI00341D917E
MEPVRLFVVGAGQRGSTYARRAAASGAAIIVGVAEADPVRRERFASAYGIERGNVFSDWASVDTRTADAAVIATQDRDHEGPAVRLAGLGYHLLLEKPMAPSFESASRIAEAAVEAGVMLAVCHVLRYTSYTRAIKAVLDSGRIGRIVSMQHLEPVGWWHHAHSFVRGNWRSTSESSPMLLAKSCHDIDWLLYLAGQPARRVSSFGGLAHFTPESKPAGAGDRCVSCAVEASCPYSAVRLYSPAEPGWPRDVLGDDVDLALKEGPYGECVYNGQNDVVDHQVVNLELADGATVSFTMTAFTPFEQRKTRIFGTHGYLSGNGARLRLVDFRTGSSEVIEVGDTVVAGHDDGDDGVVDAFLAAVAAGDPTLIRSDAATSLAGHRVVWAAEEARALGTVVTLS